MSIQLVNGSAVMHTVDVIASTAAEFIGVCGDGVFVVPRSAVETDAHGTFSRSFRRGDDNLAAEIGD